MHRGIYRLSSLTLCENIMFAISFSSAYFLCRYKSGLRQSVPFRNYAKILKYHTWSDSRWIQHMKDICIDHYYYQHKQPAQQHVTNGSLYNWSINFCTKVSVPILFIISMSSITRLVMSQYIWASIKVCLSLNIEWSSSQKQLKSIPIMVAFVFLFFLFSDFIKSMAKHL